MPLAADVPSRARPITRAETAALVLLSVLVSAVLASYLLDLVGVRLRPSLIVALSATAAIGTAGVVGRAAVRARAESAAFAVVVLLLFSWLLWLSRPAWLPLSTGPDLTHHLILIHYIEGHWQFVHDQALQQYLGEMAQYTPGSHVLAALAGAWSGTDGLRALHPLQAWTVALKAGFVLLIGFRLLPAAAPRPLALLGVVLPLAAPRYFLGGFTEFGFVAQVVAELFVVSLWWTLVAWDADPDVRLDLVFGLTAAATFLTWPVYVGPPALAFTVVAAMHGELPAISRLRHGVIANAPLAVVALVYLVGRLGWLQLAATGGTAPWPSAAAFGWPLVLMATLGLGVATARRRGRASAVFALAVMAQTSALYLLATRRGAAQPYMALKMFYLWLWPMAALGAMTLGEAWRLVAVVLPSARRPRVASVAAWLVVVAASALVARPLVRAPRLLHPLPPATTLPLYDAGRWARAHLPPACIEYLVADDETAYWLHLAVLGNPRISARTGDNSTYEPKDALVRWLTPGGLPYAIADLPTLPRDVRDELDIVQTFGTAAIARRRGAFTCDQTP